MDNLNPIWPKLTITAQDLCNCDPYTPLKIMLSNILLCISDSWFVAFEDIY